MQLFKRLRFFIGMAFALSLVAMPIAKAAAPAQPDPLANPVLATLQKMGTKFYYLGTHGGMDGWFLVKDGRVQIAYSLPDKQGIIIGAMFDAGGSSVTAAQIKSLVETNKDVNALMSSAAQDQAALVTNSASASATSPSSGAAAIPATSLSPGERLMQELTAASGVTIGTGKPQILMVMDPNCPHCQATWKALRPSVMQGALQIRMIPIGTANSDNERAAAEFLHASDPLTTWDKYVGGDKSQLAGTPDPSLLTAVRANHILIDDWNIQVTPYMVYRAKDGKVKIVQGELDKPEKLAVLLADLGP